MTTNRPHNICEDGFTPHSRLRKAAGEMLEQNNGKLCYMASSGTWQNAKLEVVWTNMCGERIRSFLSCEAEGEVQHASHVDDR